MAAKLISTTLAGEPIRVYQGHDGKFYGLTWMGDLRIVTAYYDTIEELREDIKNKTATWFDIRTL